MVRVFFYAFTSQHSTNIPSNYHIVQLSDQLLSPIGELLGLQVGASDRGHLEPVRSKVLVPVQPSDGSRGDSLVGQVGLGGVEVAGERAGRGGTSSCRDRNRSG